MFRNNPSRTGLYGKAVPPTLLDVYVGSDDVYLYLIDGTSGAVIDRFQVYTDAGKGIHTSPSVADIDGDNRLEIVFYDWGKGSNRKGNTFWCLEDTSAQVGYSVVIGAICWTEGKHVSVNITKDGEPTNHTTPHAFHNLAGTHTFTVPDHDPNGHAFIAWNTGETDTTITVETIGAFVAYYGANVHDVVVKDLTSLNKTIVGQDCSMPVNVTVENQGNFTETFNIIVYQGNFKPEWEIFWVKGDVNGDGYIDDSDGDLITAAWATTPGDPNWNPSADLDKDGIVDIHDLTILAYNYGLNISGYLEVPPTIGTKQLVIDLPPSQEATVTITLNTTGIAKDNYTISAHVIPVLGETNTTDNTCIDGYVAVAMFCDINADGKVDLKDVFAVALAYGSFPGHPKWNPNLDINDDGKIDLKDYYATCLNYGKVDP